MSISSILDPNTNDESWKVLEVYGANINQNAAIGGTLTVNNLTVTGNSNLSSASARYNLAPQPPSRVGLIGGYLILSSDPNPSFVPFTTTTPQGLYDYISPNGNFHMVDPYTLQIDVAGFYNFSFQMIILSNSAAQVIFQLLSSDYPYVVGQVPPALSSVINLGPVNSIFPFLPYSNGGSIFSNSLVNCTQNQQFKIAYIINDNGEIPGTSCLSINKVG